MSRAEWMLEEISTWLNEGIVDSATAERLAARYGDRRKRSMWGAMFAGVVGAILIGLGTVALSASLLASNWGLLGRTARAAVALAPPIACAAIAFAAICRGWKSMHLWEPLGILWALLAGAAVPIVAETYNSGMGASSLLLLSAFLILPIVWITRAMLPAVLWPLFAIFWVLIEDPGYSGCSIAYAAKALGIVAISIPGYVAFIRRKPSRATLATAQFITGLVYSIVPTAILMMTLPKGMRVCSDLFVVLVMWAFLALLLVCGAAFKLPVWPFMSTFMASLVAGAVPFCDSIKWYTAFFGFSIAMSIATAAYGACRLKLAYANVGVSLFLWFVLCRFFQSEMPAALKGVLLISAGVVLVVLNVVLRRVKKGARTR